MAINASEIPGATALIVAWVASDKPTNEFTIPRTVPNSPTYGLTDPMLARSCKCLFKFSPSLATLTFTDLWTLSKSSTDITESSLSLEYSRLKEDSVISVEDLESVQRSVKVRVAKEGENLNKHLQLLANIGSVSPYVGLFGTVLGIVNSFVGLSDATQATINAVAPGISEALIATALGLFAAIPALIAYNRFVSLADQHIKSLLIFGEELVSILYREVTRK